MIKCVAVAAVALGLPAGQSFVGPSAGVVRVSDAGMTSSYAEPNIL